ncbi:hypothetical protein DQ240_20445 [Blastococcus sp. TF02A-26]|nr:hypothetical protein DQ240_20445 [Blastococcus sp. TF02A-26]
MMVAYAVGIHHATGSPTPGAPLSGHAEVVAAARTPDLLAGLEPLRAAARHRLVFVWGTGQEDGFPPIVRA